MAVESLIFVFLNPFSGGCPGPFGIWKGNLWILGSPSSGNWCKLVRVVSGSKYDVGLHPSDLVCHSDNIYLGICMIRPFVTLIASRTTPINDSCVIHREVVSTRRPMRVRWINTHNQLNSAKLHPLRSIESNKWMKEWRHSSRGWCVSYNNLSCI